MLSLNEGLLVETRRVELDTSRSDEDAEVANVDELTAARGSVEVGAKDNGNDEFLFDAEEAGRGSGGGRTTEVFVGTTSVEVGAGAKVIEAGLASGTETFSCGTTCPAVVLSVLFKFLV